MRVPSSAYYVMKITKTKIVAAIGTLIWLATLAFASIYDLDISIKIANKSSLFGRVLEVAGEPPAILFTSFNFALMAAYFGKCDKRRVRGVPLAVLTVIGCVGTCVFTTVKIVKYLAEYKATEPSALTTLYAVCAGFIIAFVFIMLALFMNEETLQKYFRVAWRCALAAILTFLIIWEFKLVWGRVRPRQLELGGGYFAYTPWYLPQGFTGYFSFPSGHTANATVILSSLYYLRFLPQKFKWLKPICIALLAVWIVLVAFSRVVVGAHFLSDVLFGMAITLCIVYFCKPKEKQICI